MEKQVEAGKVLVRGEPAAGPNEKAGKDAVTADMSWANLGKQVAMLFAKADDSYAVRITNGVVTLRSDIITVLDSAPESWASFIFGIEQVKKAREKDGKPVNSLKVTLSRVKRIIGNAERNYEKTINLLKDDAVSFEDVLLSLDKLTNRGKPAKQARPAADTIKSPEVVNKAANGETVELAKETAVGSLMQIIAGAAERLIELGKGRHAPYAWYVGQSIKDYLVTVNGDFQKIMSDNPDWEKSADGKNKLLIELGLIEVPVEATPAAAAVAS